jgi:hypothetical protein
MQLDSILLLPGLYTEDKPTLNIIKLHSYDEQDAIIDLDIFNS